MSILIEGMEIPTFPLTRTIEISYTEDGSLMAIADGGEVYSAVPVPEVAKTERRE